MSKERTTNRYEKYRGQMCGILLDPDTMKETDELRGETPRSKYICNALREYNKRRAILRQKLAEAERELCEIEKGNRALMQNASTSDPTVGHQGDEIERPASMGFVSSSSVSSTSLYPSSTRQDELNRGGGGRKVG
jgi:hypothetical protein